jgi:hypothetical protein
MALSGLARLPLPRARPGGTAPSASALAAMARGPASSSRCARACPRPPRRALLARPWRATMVLVSAPSPRGSTPVSVRHAHLARPRRGRPWRDPGSTPLGAARSPARRAPPPWRAPLPGATPRFGPRRAAPCPCTAWPLRGAAPARRGFGSRGRGAPMWCGPLPAARPRRVRDLFTVRKRGLAHTRAHVVRAARRALGATRSALPRS